MKNKINYKNGIKFECQSSSNCCVSRNSYGFVYLSKKDLFRLSKFTNLKTKDFINLYCDKKDNFIRFKELNMNGKCQFLYKKKCTVYKARPMQCRTWPFWNENMNTKTWNEEIKNHCPGIGKGKLFTYKKIKKIIKKDLLNDNKILEK